jgi:hypothetical protein
MVEQLPEINAMAEIAALFASLEEDEVQRVLRWANEKYRPKGAAGGGGSREASSTPTSAIDVNVETFDDLPALVDAACPTSGLERILVGGYFHQVVKQEPDFDSQTLNTELKHLGHPSANITRDIDRLVNRSPKLVIQTRKEGTTRQARKRFRLTTEGVRAVEALLKASTSE